MISNEKTIAVVVREQATLNRIQCLLGAGQFKVQGFADAKAFLESSAKDACTYLVCGIDLESISGFELVRNLRASGYAYPTIYVHVTDGVLSAELDKSTMEAKDDSASEIDYVLGQLTGILYTASAVGVDNCMDALAFLDSLLNDYLFPDSVAAGRSEKIIPSSV